MRPARKLIVAADDFGLTARVNEAIAKACRHGIVTTASLMVTAAGFESAVEIARRESSLDVGLHLNLSEGHPVTNPARIPSLADSGGFRYRHPLQLAAAFIRGRIAGGDLEREVRAQLEKAVDSQLQITHVDGHKHVHVIPAVLNGLRKIAPEYGIHAVRSSRERVPRLASMLARQRQSAIQIVKQYAFGKTISAVERISKRNRGLPVLFSPKQLYGITQTGFLDLEVFADIVHDLDEGIHELMCHPGYVDDELTKTPTRLLEQRERELALLTGSEVRHLLKNAGVALISYRDLVENYGNTRRNPVFDRYSAL
jgi:hopanoid biosynthesis associated protein HpnK